MQLIDIIVMNLAKNSVDLQIMLSRIPYVQGFHRKMVRFQESIENWFLTLHGFNTPSEAMTVHVSDMWGANLQSPSALPGSHTHIDTGIKLLIPDVVYYVHCMDFTARIIRHRTCRMAVCIWDLRIIVFKRSPKIEIAWGKSRREGR